MWLLFLNIQMSLLGEISLILCCSVIVSQSVYEKPFKKPPSLPIYRGFTTATGIDFCSTTLKCLHLFVCQIVNYICLLSSPPCEVQARKVKWRKKSQCFSHTEFWKCAQEERKVLKCKTFVCHFWITCWLSLP